jgi:MscS family membrane protein
VPHRRYTLAVLLLVLLVSAPSARAQLGTGAPTAPAAEPQQAKDALGRDTPRGAVIGFMSAARQRKDELSPQYLNTNLKGQSAVELAHQLYVVLDSRLPARLNELSNRPEGTLANPLKPDEDIVGTISTSNGPLEIVLERVTPKNSPPVWLFSKETLSSIPQVYAEVDLITLDRFLPDTLARPRIAGIRLFEWLVLILLLPFCYRLLAALNWVLKPLVAFAHRRLGVPDEQADHQVPGLVRLVVIAIAIRWGLASLDLPLLERQFWAATARLLMIVALGWLLLLLNKYGEGYLLRRFANRELTALLRLARRGADVLALSFCGFLVLRYFGFDPTAALAGLGIGGIAVALAAQKTLENVIAGLSLIFDKAVRVGDSLKFGEMVGTVDYIGLRSTRIRTLDRTILSVPNGQIASVGIETLSERDKYRFRHVVGLRYGTTVDQMRAVIDAVRALLLKNANTDSDSVQVRFFRLGSFSLDIEIVAYVFAGDWGAFLTIQQDLLLQIMEVIERAGTAIAFPSQTLHIAEGHVPGQILPTAETPSSASKTLAAGSVAASQ